MPLHVTEQWTEHTATGCPRARKGSTYFKAPRLSNGSQQKADTMIDPLVLARAFLAAARLDLSTTGFDAHRETIGARIASLVYRGIPF